MRIIKVIFEDGYEMKVTVSNDTDVKTIFGNDVIIEEE